MLVKWQKYFPVDLISGFKLSSTIRSQSFQESRSVSPLKTGSEIRIVITEEFINGQNLGKSWRDPKNWDKTSFQDKVQLQTHNETIWRRPSYSFRNHWVVIRYQVCQYNDQTQANKMNHLQQYEIDLKY